MALASQKYLPSRIFIQTSFGGAQQLKRTAERSETGSDVFLKSHSASSVIVLDTHVTELNACGWCACRGIYAECAKILWEEVDYINEGRNADRFRRNFAAEDWVRVPRIYWRQTTPVVLTLEYMPGLKVTDKQALLKAGINPVNVARTATEAYLLQILR